jgi:hypothetical protein
MKSNDSDVKSPSSEHSSCLNMAMSDEASNHNSANNISANNDDTNYNNMYTVKKQPGKIRPHQTADKDRILAQKAKLLPSSVAKIKRQYEKTAMEFQQGQNVPVKPKPPRIITPRRDAEILPYPSASKEKCAPIMINTGASANLKDPARKKQNQKNSKKPEEPISNHEQLQAQILHQQSILNTMNSMQFQQAQQQQVQQQIQQQMNQFYHFIPIPNPNNANAMTANSKTGPLMVSPVAQSGLVSGSPSPAASSIGPNSLPGVDISKFPVFTATTTPDGKLLLLPANPNALMASQQKVTGSSQFMTLSIEQNLNQQQLLLSLLNQKHQQMNSLTLHPFNQNNGNKSLPKNTQFSKNLPHILPRLPEQQTSSNSLIQHMNGESSSLLTSTAEQQVNSISSLIDQTEMLKEKLRLEEEKNSILLSQMNAEKKKMSSKTRDGLYYLKSVLKHVCQNAGQLLIILYRNEFFVQEILNKYS